MQIDPHPRRIQGSRAPRPVRYPAKHVTAERGDGQCGFNTRKKTRWRITHVRATDNVAVDNAVLSTRKLNKQVETKTALFCRALPRHNYLRTTNLSRQNMPHLVTTFER